METKRALCLTSHHVLGSFSLLLAFLRPWEDIEEVRECCCSILIRCYGKANDTFNEASIVKFLLTIICAILQQCCTEAIGTCTLYLFSRCNLTTSRDRQTHAHTHTYTHAHTHTCVGVIILQEHVLDDHVAIQLVRVVVFIPPTPVLVSPLNGQVGPLILPFPTLPVFLEKRDK